jgi:hypothetical protein
MNTDIPPNVKRGLREAWERSQADDPQQRHEEGGYVVEESNGTLGVREWPHGAGAFIAPPRRAPDGTYQGRPVAGEYHTHPNPSVDEQGRHWEQEPSEVDLIGLQQAQYSGDSYVVSRDRIYRIRPDGSVEDLGLRQAILAQ